MAKSRLALLAVALASVGVITFLALRGSPWVGELPWVPPWLADWADNHGNLRNLPAFAALTLVLIPVLGWRLGACVAALMGVGLETAQVFISGRTFDWADIGWSLAGVATVAVPAWMISRKHPKFRRKSQANA